MKRFSTRRAMLLRGGALVILPLLGGCAMTTPEGEQRTVVIHPGGDTSLDPVTVPANRLPPPGECRIWYPDREPGDQPDPGDCRDLEGEVPEGAVLVRG